MEITTQVLNQVEVITIKGRVDSVEASRLEEALEAANRRGMHWLVIDMSQLEYMSSAGFRALATAQRNSKRHEQGEVILTELQPLVHAALELVGFTDYFQIIDPGSAALKHAQISATGIAGADAQPASSGG
ncbi:MAG TPA: STAS domain-containing protein [Anaerolineales bacterium]|nr:STAS domain-containing protein [Anaerolineales bacterium]